MNTRNHHHFALTDLNASTSRCLCFKRGIAEPFATFGVPWAEEVDAYVPIPDALTGAQVQLLLQRFRTETFQLHAALNFASSNGTPEARDHAGRIRAEYEQLLSETLVRSAVVLSSIERVLSHSGFHTLEAFARAFELGAWGWGEYTRAVLEKTAARCVLNDHINCIVFAPAVGCVFRRVWDCSSEAEKRQFLKRVDDPDALWDEFGLDANLEFLAA